MTGCNKTPKNWHSFLRDGNNKTELFHLLADRIAEMHTTNVIIVTKEEFALSNQMISLDHVVTKRLYTYICTCQACNNGRQPDPHDQGK